MHKLEHVFTFPDFKGAQAFVNQVAAIAERENHHPEIHWSYNRVTLKFWTHTARGVTDKDRALLKKILAESGQEG